MRQSNFFCWFIGLSIVALLVPGSAQANDQVVQTKIGPAQISFDSVANGMRLVLTVSGPNDYFLQQVHEGDFTLSAVATDGAPLADGAYTYEVRAEPILSAAVSKALAAARQSGDYSVVTRLQREGTLPAEALVQSGSFRVAGGSFVGAAAEPPVLDDDSDTGSTKDQQILDDLIVDGSLCVGFDCVNGESFGFDTIRLKENNLRIKFYDTSNSASFPSNDWQITANETSNGGLNKFSIDDIDGGRTPFTIEASAPSHSLYVDDGGRVGFGTSTPVTDLHVKSGNTPTLRLEQDGSSGFTAQTWDVAGNEANFFIRDATNGSTLPFRIYPGAPSNAIYINSSGNVGLGTTSPDRNLDIEGSGPGFRLTNTGSGGGLWDWKVNANNGRMNITDDATAARVPIKFQPGADNNLFKVGVEANDRVDITGVLYISGSQVTPDYVFEPDYQLETIEEHGEYMLTNRHLPAVGAAEINEEGAHLVDVGARSQGLLEELEKAHLYILQLNQAIKELESLRIKVQELEARLATSE